MRYWQLAVRAWSTRNSISCTTWKVSKYGLFSGPYFSVFSSNTGKYGPEKTPYLHVFHSVMISNFRLVFFPLVSLFGMLFVFRCKVKKQPSRGVLIKRCSENMQQICRRTPIPKCDFNKVAKELYWNHTLAWVFSCKFNAYFQNIFSLEHLWRAASESF